MKVLMVCLGNICRSPLAEGILAHKAIKAGLDWEVDSAGTAGYHVGEPPHPLSIKVAKLNGIDISHQTCRRFTKADMFLFDKIFVMDEENYTAIMKIAGDKWDANKVDYILNLSNPGKNLAVPDPWYGNEDGYHAVFELLSKAIDRLIEQVAGY